MFLAQLLMLSHLAFAGVAPAAFHDQQTQIDQAMVDIMGTEVGRTICTRILNADAGAIEFHLGVSAETAKRIAAGCNQPSVGWDWILQTPAGVIRKSTPRKYEILQSMEGFPIESWTDWATNDEPTNQTVILIRPALPGEDEAAYAQFFRSRLTELLAHELAVYFDSKSNPAHPDARYLTVLRSLTIKSTSKLSPLTAISNPLTAHTLTYIRALQVERQIMQELISAGKIDAPADFYDPFIQFLVSSRCKEACLADRILDMRQAYYPMALPMLAFASYYRAMMQSALPALQTNLTPAQWSRVNSAMGVVAADFLTHSSSGERLKDLKTFFFDNPASHPKIGLVTLVMRDDLLPLELPALFDVPVSSVYGDETLLEFMKRPLLSGYNLFQSSGPRVRIRTGNIELLNRYEF